MANYREPQWLLPNEKNLAMPASDATVGSGLGEDRQSLYSMDFDGTDYISAPNTFLNSASVCTLSFWMKGTGEVGGGSAWNGLQLGVGGGYATFRTMNGSNVNNYVSFSPGTDWHHYLGVYVGGSYSKLYIDGVLKQTLSSGIPATLASNSGDVFKIGYGFGYSVAEIDEVAVWTKALSDGDVADGATATGEIATIYNSGAPGNLMALGEKPMAYYPLGEQARRGSEWQFPNEVLQSQVFDFDGTDYIDCGDGLGNLLGAANENLTFSMWFNINSAPNNDGLLTLSSGPSAGNTGGVAVQIQNSTNINIYWNSSAATLTYSTPSLNTWHNLTVVKNGATVTTYIDGAVSTPTATSGSVPSSIDFSGLSTLIGMYWDTSYTFNGKISNVALWDSALDAPNIANIYNNGSPQSSYTTTPTAWYKLNATSNYAGLNPNFHNALDFVDTPGDKIEITSPSSSMQPTTTLTLSFWANFQQDANWMLSNGGWGQASSGNNGYSIQTFAGRSLRFYLGNGTTSDYFGTNTGVFELNKWHHIVITYDNGAAVIYIDGNVVTWLTSPSINSIAYSASYNPFFGSVNSGGAGANAYDGLLSNAAIFNQVISAEDVLYLYNGGTPQTNISFEPVSWWKLDNLTTGIQDFGSASNNGTNNGATAVSSSVAVDQWNFDNVSQAQTPDWSSALDFTGVNGVYVDVANDSSINFTSAFSVGFWFKTTSSAVMYTSHGGSGDIKYYIQWYQPINRLRLTIYDGSGVSVDVDNTQVFDDGNWHHLAFTTDGTTSADQVIVYFDGKALPTTGTLSNSGIKSTAGSLKIGAYVTTQNTFNGELSNFATWNSVLSSANIETLYNSGQPETAISSSPVSWYKLDNTASGIQDSGSASNNGTNNSTTETQTNVWTPRLNGESTTLPSTALVSSDLQFESPYSNFSLDFDGTNDYISTGLDLDSYNSFSISTWVKADTLASNKMVCAQYRKGSSFSNSSWVLYIEAPGGTPYMTFYIFSGGSAILAGKNTVLSTGQWYHIAATWDGSTSKLYINGVKETTEGTVSSMNSTIVNTLIGASNDSAGTGTTGFWDGNIDEVAIWNSALTQAQISQVYNNGYPADLTSLSPTSWWRLGEDAWFDGSDFIIPNQITGAPNGTSANMDQADLVADAPGSYASGVGNSLIEADRVGDAPESTANSLSVNMIPSNRISYPAGYVPTQVDNVYSMAFDGLTDYMTSNTNGISGLNNASISVWVKPTGSTSNQYKSIINQWEVSNMAWGLWLNGAGSTYTIHWNQAGAAAVDSGLIIPNDVWSHIAVVKNATTLKMFHNGSEVSSFSISAATGSGATILNIGAQYTSSAVATFFNGNIDEVAIFDYALSARQVKQDIYEGTTTGKTADLNNISNLTAPVAWYRMGD